MKSLSLTRPLVLMIIGIPGAGKSYFARQFAETFHAPLVSTDFIRSTIFTAPTFSRAEEDIIDDIADNQVNELLKTQKTFLVDGGLNSRTDRIGIQKSARENGYGCLLIWVQTDEPTCRMRVTKRNKKRIGDALNVPLTEVQFATHSKRLTPPSPQESYIVISGKHTYATQAKVVLKKLITPREDPPAHQPTIIPQAPPHETPRRRNVIIN